MAEDTKTGSTRNRRELIKARRDIEGTGRDNNNR